MNKLVPEHPQDDDATALLREALWRLSPKDIGPEPAIGLRDLRSRIQEYLYRKDTQT